MLVHPSGIDLSNSTLRYLSGLLRARRRERGTRWRRPTADRQALLALAHLRCGHTYAQLAAGFGIGLATVYRYIADAFGRLLWASQALPGAVHDIKAARTHGIIEALTQAGTRTWADKGYQGARETMRVPYRRRWSTLPAGKRAVNSSHARIRAVGEQANATLKSWRLPRKLRCSTTRIADIVKAVLALHLATAA